MHTSQNLLMFLTQIGFKTENSAHFISKISKEGYFIISIRDLTQLLSTSISPWQNSSTEVEKIKNSIQLLTELTEADEINNSNSDEQKISDGLKKGPSRHLKLNTLLRNHFSNQG